jgi:hypothetical protein
MKSATSFFAIVVGGVIGLVGVILAGLAALAFLANTLDVLNGRSIASYIPILAAGGFGGLLIFLAKHLFDQPNREEAARRQEQEAAARRAAEQAASERNRAAQAAQIARTLARAEGALFGAQSSAAQLPVLLGEAELALDRAERELAEKLPSPFWEAMEDAALRLSDFDNSLRAIDRNRQEHQQLAQALNGKAPEFSLGVSVLPDPANTNQRINTLFRRAQKMRDFPIIYEQRRTNTILIEGFRSLGNAIASLGAQLQSELAALGDQLDFRLSDLESALRDSASQLAEQHREQLEFAEAARSEQRNSNAEIAQIARDRLTQAEKRATESRDYERTTLRMFDNIQRRRRPLPPQIGDGTF